MGLGNFKDVQRRDGEQATGYYGHHEYNERLEEMVEDLQERFPEEIEYDYIEVSPKLKKCWAKAYWKGDSTYIRVAEFFIEEYDEEMIKMTVAHEMVHLYTYQNDRADVSDNNRVFNWMLGMVGADISRISPDSDVWKELVEPFLEHRKRQQ